MVTEEGIPGGVSADRKMIRTGAARTRGLALAIFFFLVFGSIACSPAAGLSPEAERETNEPGAVTVPDEISRFDSDEVERRLGRLLGDDDSNALSAPDVQPTETPEEPTIEEILELLNSATPVSVAGELVISIGQETLRGLAAPRLTIKTAPLHGTARVVSPDRIFYVPGPLTTVDDSFEYELFDGEKSVISQVVEVRN